MSAVIRERKYDFQQNIVHPEQGSSSKLESLKCTMMWGIKYCMTQRQGATKHEALGFASKDFKSFHKVKVNICNYIIDGLQLSSFQFKEYCPAVFADLRAKFGIDDAAYLASWTGQPADWDSSCRGHSDSRFLRSHDGQFYAKTIAGAEATAVLQLLPGYRDHVTACLADTLLPQLLAVYRVTLASGKHHVLVMRSVFPPRTRLLRKYDLKGCRVARRASRSEQAAATTQLPPTLKDEDFLDSGERLRVSAATQARLVAALTRDVAFLRDRNLMDYSLLVGVHDCPPLAGAEDAASSEHRFLVPASEAASDLWYSFGLIDILTNYGVSKRLANLWKRLRYPASGGPANAFSTVPPPEYAARFLRFLDQLCFPQL